MLTHKKIENAILSSARLKDTESLKTISMILDHKTRVVNARLEKLMVGETFEQKPKYRLAYDEYSAVDRLKRIVSSYAS